jgi:hypothetical protein
MQLHFLFLNWFLFIALTYFIKPMVFMAFVIVLWLVFIYMYYNVMLITREISGVNR